MTRGEVAQQAGVHVETLRYYEQRGLLPEPPRRPSGYRMYPSETVKRLKFILAAKDLGFTLREIRVWLELLDANQAGNCTETRPLVEAKLKAIETQMQRLETMRAALLDLQTTCVPAEPSCFVQALYANNHVS